MALSLGWLCDSKQNDKCLGVGCQIDTINSLHWPIRSALLSSFRVAAALMMISRGKMEGIFTFSTEAYHQNIYRREREGIRGGVSIELKIYTEREREREG